jgi:general stress protein YciG
MPTGNYSYPGDGEPRPFAITEPADPWGRSHGSIEQREHEDEARTVRAKEPDRQATRRGAQGRSRTAMAEDYDQEDQPRSRGGQRGTTNRRGAQPRRGQMARRAVTGGGRQKKSRRGFAAMSPEQQREIARKGGLTVSRNRRHMADIGRVGGEHSHGGRRGRR